MQLEDRVQDINPINLENNTTLELINSNSSKLSDYNSLQIIPKYSHHQTHMKDQNFLINHSANNFTIKNNIKLRRKIITGKESLKNNYKHKNIYYHHQRT